MTTPLSPAAQAVLDAYNQDRPVGDSLPRNALVEALRAAADQADPKKHVENIDTGYVHQMYTDGCYDTIATFLNIADELEAH